MLLAEGLNVKYKTLLNLMGLPFAITPLYGIIIDTQYIKKLGKVKTYTTICPLLYSSLLFF